MSITHGKMLMIFYLHFFTKHAIISKALPIRLVFVTISDFHRSTVLFQQYRQGFPIYRREHAAACRNRRTAACFDTGGGVVFI